MINEGDKTERAQLTEDQPGFGRLTVIGFIGRNSRRQDRWLCVCECGEMKEVFGYNLKNGAVQSCGCLRRDANKARAKHGHARRGSHTPEYRSWKSMLWRCRRPERRNR